MHEWPLPSRRPSTAGFAPPARFARAAGFTLIELLVALLITAIVFVMGYRTLSQALTSRKQVDEQAARLLAVQQAMRTIEQDFELLQPRPVRSLSGSGYEAALTTSTTAALGSLTNASLDNSNAGTPLVTLTRAGWTNPAGLPRSELQRVTYLYGNGKLIRAWWPVLDATSATPQQQRVLLDNVKSVSLRFMDSGQQWRTDWPASAAGASAPQLGLRLRPIVVEVTLELNDWGVIVRTLEIPG
jgi:general secretion pathway protein J